MPDIETLYLNYLDMTQRLDSEPMTFDEYKEVRKTIQGQLAVVDAELIVQKFSQRLS